MNKKLFGGMWGIAIGEGSKHGLKQTFFVGIVVKITEINAIYLFLCLLHLRHFAEENTQQFK